MFKNTSPNLLILDRLKKKGEEIMYRDLPNDLRLWPHQKTALEFLTKRLNANTGPCLVRMPTGTGKTGVIACLSLLSASGRTLVLTPWANLRDQVIDALKCSFWKSIGRVPPQGKIVEMLPSTAKALIKDTQVKVVVCTFSTLTDLRRVNPSIYQELANFIDTVIVDECHYEPAIEWGRAVKGLAKPMVLLTATPYRNDLKLFRIGGTNDVLHFTHAQAENNSIIRTLDFVSLSDSTDIRSMSREFAHRWKKMQSDKRLASANPRAIVCCAGAAEIRIVVLALKSEGLDAIGIHEQFKNSADCTLLRDVPPRTNLAQIWVHQNKLTEGLDDHQFCGLAFMCDVNSDRKLVQQIGRILRAHNTDAPKAPAIVMAPPKFELRERWQAYREFETDTHVMDVDHFRRVVEGVLASQPLVEYFDGRFRKRFKPDILSTNPQVAIAPSVLIRKIQPDFKLSDYIEDCTDSLNLTDAVILGHANAPCQQSGEHALWVYASVDNSRILEDTSLYEVTLQAHCAVLAGDYLLVSDTTGTYPSSLLEERTIGIGAADLARLIDASYRVTNVATSSAVPFDTVLRASEHRGHDLHSIPASLTDRVQICRAARGTKPGTRRYVGLHRGRVREELPERMRRRHSISHFKAWARSISKALAAANGNHPVLQRYMQPCTAPSSPIAVSVSIDLSHPDIDVIDSKGGSLTVMESSVSVKACASGNPHLFECDFKFLDGDTSKKAHPALLTIEFQQAKGRFWFKSRDVTDVYVVANDGIRIVQKNLAEFLNQNQALILIGLEGGSLVYQGRSFYEIDYSYAEKSLFDQIVRPAIAACANEKGTKAQIEAAKIDGSKITQFIEGSLFKRIAERNLPLGFTPELVICDDLGSECADFILANIAHKELALVHAKAGDGAGISASSFHDVVAQAMKNLVYLTRAGEMPSGAGSWIASERWNNTDIPRLYLAPPSYPTGPNLWVKLRDEIITSANGKLHVVLATTGCCDITQLKEAVADPAKRTAETAQLLHLLDGLIGYARQLGVRVTIFDVPFSKSKTKKTKASGSVAKVSGAVAKTPLAKKIDATNARP
ncbi:DEAD/DEAH box helicase [Pseudomonas sp. p99-361]|uniref:DEAD/DEAH box helicase n=1 Tax=Pseudomonas TaxID=286 RepID=UPI001315385A|nr:DEAD/DEAH box helicase family protein [Pseudomonas sp. p99-361]